MCRIQPRDTFPNTQKVSHFVTAVRHGDPTDINPVGIGQDPEEWASTLWRSPKYWLMVSGNRAALKPAQAIRVRLPELPEGVKSAYEFDTATLAVHETPIVRDNTGIYVDVTSGFAAVLFPLADCPAYVQVDDLPALHAGETTSVNLSAFAPWRGNAAPVEVTASVPGLTVSPAKLTLPGRITISAPQDAEPGSYFLQITGPDNLPARRWMQYKIGTPVKI